MLYLVKKTEIDIEFSFLKQVVCCCCCLFVCFNVKKCLVAANFLPVLDYSDPLHMHACTHCLVIRLIELLIVCL